MALFKFRKGGDESLPTPSQAESIEAMRRRARHRLIGAAVLLLLGVVGFPLLFDTQPRPIALDIPIEIPDRNQVKPLQLPAQPKAPAAVAAGAVTESPAAAQKSPATASVEDKPAAAPAAVEPAKPEVKPEPRPEPKAVAKAPPREPSASAPKTDDGAKARALLEGKPVQADPPAAAADGRFVVQVGAFADAAKAREVRLKLETAGLKTYTHVAQTKDGPRIRVRVGPFASRADADQSAARIKGLDLPATVLTL